MTPLPLALPMAPHQSVPRDRAIWIIANIITREDCFTSVDRYEGYAEWSEASQDWQDDRRMSIRVNYAAELRILEWEERKSRAARASEDETSVGGNVYFWDDEYRRSYGQAGYFALCRLTHTPTLYELASLTEGPFATRAQALGELAGMLTKITSTGAAA